MVPWNVELRSKEVSFLLVTDSAVNLIQLVSSSLSSPARKIEFSRLRILTLAPIVFASCMAAMPTPPAAE